MISRAKWVIALAVSIVACGSKPAVKDPSEENSTPSANDEAPKWDSSSTTNDKPEATAPTSGPVVATPVAATGRSGDVYDKVQTEIVLKRAARQVKANCGAATNEDGKAVGPWGKTKITVVLGHNGHSKSATMQAPFDGKPSGRCAAQAFNNLTFPPWGGADLTLDWDIEIDQPAGAK